MSDKNIFLISMSYYVKCKQTTPSHRRYKYFLDRSLELGRVTFWQNWQQLAGSPKSSVKVMYFSDALTFSVFKVLQSLWIFLLLSVWSPYYGQRYISVFINHLLVSWFIFILQKTSLFTLRSIFSLIRFIFNNFYSLVFSYFKF